MIFVIGMPTTLKDKNGINNTSIDHYKVIGGEHWWLDIEYEGLNTNRIIWDFVSKYDTNGLR